LIEAPCLLAQGPPSPNAAAGVLSPSSRSSRLLLAGIEQCRLPRLPGRSGASFNRDGIEKPKSKEAPGHPGLDASIASSICAVLS
jgi:hypothetical protein